TGRASRLQKGTSDWYQIIAATGRLTIPAGPFVMTWSCHTLPVDETLTLRGPLFGGRRHKPVEAARTHSASVGRQRWRPSQPPYREAARKPSGHSSRLPVRRSSRRQCSMGRGGAHCLVEVRAE